MAPGVYAFDMLSEAFCTQATLTLTLTLTLTQTLPQEDGGGMEPQP